MRMLTVSRSKSPVGRAGAVKLFIADSEHPEIELLGIPCRPLGSLINGESQWFSVTEDMVTLFALWEGEDKTAPDEVTSIALPAGNLPVKQAGVCKKSPTGKTVFVFDVGDMGSRRAKQRKLLAVAAFALCVVVAVVASILTAPLRVKRETFQGEGYTITLPEEFFRADYSEQGYIGAYSNEEMSVVIVKVPFSDLGGAASMDEFVDMERAASLSGLTLYNLTDTVREDGLVYYTYDIKAGWDMFTERNFFYKSADAFWLVCIRVPPKDFDRMESEIMRWAKSFRMENANAAPGTLALPLR